MALSVKVDTNELPSILKLLGVSGITENAADATPAPQPDNYVMQSSENSDQSQNPAPTKLMRLQQTLSAPSESSASEAPPGLLSGIVPGSSPSPLPDLGTPESDVRGSFGARHPGVLKTLGLVSQFAQNAGPGIGAPTFGQGFQAAAEAPAKREMAAAQLAHTKAVTDQMKSQVTLPNGLTVPFALAAKLYPTLLTEKGKNERNQANIESREGIASDKKALDLRKHGLKANPNDPNGPPVPLGYDELSPSEQAHYDLLQAQKGYTDARAAYEKAKSDPNSPQSQAALERMRTARMNAQTALGRLNLGNLKYRGDYLGIDAQGNPLPGAPLAEDNTPIGLKTAGLTKPTNATRSKAEQGNVVLQQGNDLLKQIDAHPDIYGVVAGRWNEFNAGKFGNADQDVRDAYTSLKSFAALQPALHGSRGIGMQKEFEDAVGSLGNNPEGLKGSINSLMRTATEFKKAGTMKTAPGGATLPKAIADQIQEGHQATLSDGSVWQKTGGVVKKIK